MAYPSLLLLLLVSCSDYKLDAQRPEPTVSEPDIEVSPAELEWASIGVDCAADQVVTISNVGAGPLSIEGTTITGSAAWSSEFLTDTLAPGESVRLVVRFAPGQAGDFTGQLSVVSDDPDEPTVDVPAIGTAAASRPTSDRFIQEAAPVDVLWVIDNSSSMSTEQARVAAGITTFFSWFTLLNLDYHMGVITSDTVNPIYSGRLVGVPPYIDGATPSPTAELAEAINVGEEDMGNESGLRAAELALSEPLTSAENLGFLRPEARLAVVFLSDEPEQSEYDAAYYIAFFQSLKADPTHVLISGIVGETATGCATTCTDVANNAQPGDKYIEVVNAFGGVFGSICDCDLSPTLDAIGMATTRYIRSFILSELPSDSSTIAVFVEGVESTDWTYLQFTNEILFGTPPINGSEVIVRYATAVTCEE